jgi:hypothetical protein
MEGHDGEGEYVEISVPTELVRRVISAITDVMIQWEREQREDEGSFSALTGNAAMHIAVDYLDTIAVAAATETMQ